MTLRDVKTKTTRDIDADAILPMLGFHSDLERWQTGDSIVKRARDHREHLMETGSPGIYAAGDITTYPGSSS